MKIKYFTIGVLAASLLFPLAQNARAFYNAQTGCWPNRDPLEEQGGLNSYVFVENDAVSCIDALGLATLRFEVVVGRYNPFAGSGEWSQPFWAGDGDYGISDGFAWSTVSLNNAPSIWDHFHESFDYCNTVQLPGQPNGTKGDAGSILVYAKDRCGGDFTITGFYNAILAGSGPNSGYGYAVLTVDGSVLSSETITPSTPVKAPSAIIYKKITLLPGKEKKIAEYRPTLALKNRKYYGGTSASVIMTASISLYIGP